MKCHVLIDYDNVQPGRERTRLDTALNVEQLVEDLVDTLRTALPELSELRLRLYGGWVDERGQFSRIAHWLMAALEDQRGIRGGVRVFPKMAVSALCRPDARLRGTVRLEAKRRRQKMVDGLIIVDAVTLGLQEVEALCIVSDDDDLVPGVLASRVLGGVEAGLLRTVNRPSALNDTVLTACGAQVHSLLPHRRS